jgi:hypothetical protein
MALIQKIKGKIQQKMHRQQPQHAKNIIFFDIILPF